MESGEWMLPVFGYNEFVRGFGDRPCTVDEVGFHESEDKFPRKHGNALWGDVGGSDFTFSEA